MEFYQVSSHAREGPFKAARKDGGDIFEPDTWCLCRPKRSKIFRREAVLVFHELMHAIVVSAEREAISDMEHCTGHDERIRCQHVLAQLELPPNVLSILFSVAFIIDKDVTDFNEGAGRGHIDRLE